MSYRDIETIGIVLENWMLDTASVEDYLNYHGDTEQWEDAASLAEQVQWWHDEWVRLFPTINLCEHGMSKQQCYGPGHYYDEFAAMCGRY